VKSRLVSGPRVALTVHHLEEMKTRVGVVVVNSDCCDMLDGTLVSSRDCLTASDPN